MPKQKDLIKAHIDDCKDFSVTKPVRKPGKAPPGMDISKTMANLKLDQTQGSSSSKNNLNKKKKAKHPPPQFWKSNCTRLEAVIEKHKKSDHKEEEENKAQETGASKKEIEEVPASWDELLEDEVVKGENWNEHVEKEIKKNKQGDTDIDPWTELDKDLLNMDDNIDLNSLERNNTQEQRKLCLNIEISGVPRVKNEDLVFIVRKIGDFVNVAIDEFDIVSVQREVSKRNEPGLPPVPIICKFRSREKKDAIIMRIRKLRRITTQDIGFFGDLRQIFIQHHLTPYNKYLHYACKKAARVKNYRFVWVKNGKIYVRQDDGTPALRVDTIDDVDGKIV